MAYLYWAHFIVRSSRNYTRRKKTNDKVFHFETIFIFLTHHIWNFFHSVRFSYAHILDNMELHIEQISMGMMGYSIRIHSITTMQTLRCVVHGMICSRTFTTAISFLHGISNGKLHPWIVWWRRGHTNFYNRPMSYYPTLAIIYSS